MAILATFDRGWTVSRSVIDIALGFPGLRCATPPFGGTAIAFAVLRGVERIGLPDSEIVALSLCRLSRAS